MPEIDFMRKQLLLLICIFAGFISWGQKSPVGVIIQFYDDIDAEQQKRIIDGEKYLKTFQEKWVLKGFEVTLGEGQEGLVEEDYEEVVDRLKKNEGIRNVSILYRTERGTYGGDLWQLYIKPKSGYDIANYYQIGLENNYRKTYHHHYLEGVYVSEATKNATNIREMQEKLMATGDFEFVSVNTLHSLEVTVDDPYFEYQWALDNQGTPIQYSGTVGADMEISEAWDITTGAPDIKVAVLDSGTDTNHVDLKPNLLPGFDAIGGESEGYPNTDYPNDGHGTCCAGIIGAIGNNSEGVAGIAYECKIIPVKIFYYVAFGGDVIPFTSSEAGTDGIIWAVNEAKADVLSNSWGVRESEMDLLGIDTAMSNLVIEENIANGREGRGVPMLFSSGNEYDPWSIWPASHPKTISVGASSMCDELKSPGDCSPESWGSNHGANLDVTAPGVKVLTTDGSGSLGYNGFMDNNYAFFNGTSAACPNAAGVMALILSVNPELSANDARAILSITAEQVGGYDYDMSGVYGNKSFEMGYGRVNGFEAVNYTNSFANIASADIQEIANIYYQHGAAFLSSKTGEPIRVEIFDMRGRTVAKSNEVVVNLTQLIGHSGMYFARINDATHQETLRFVLE